MIFSRRCPNATRPCVQPSDVGPRAMHRPGHPGDRGDVPTPDHQPDLTGDTAHRVGVFRKTAGSAPIASAGPRCPCCRRPADELTIMSAGPPPGSTRRASRCRHRSSRSGPQHERPQVDRVRLQPLRRRRSGGSTARPRPARSRAPARSVREADLQLVGAGVRPDHDAPAAVAVDRLEHQLVEPVEHLSARSRGRRRGRWARCPAWLLAEVVVDHLRDVGVDELVVGDAVAEAR